MKRMIYFLVLVAVAIGLWLLSIPILSGVIATPQSLSDTANIFGPVSSLFSGLALAGVIYTVYLQTIGLDDTRKNLDQSMRLNKLAAELVALTALMQEADAALERYERWGRESGSNDYSRVQEKVRNKLRDFRGKVERHYDALQIDGDDLPN